ncbi:N/A [soil metagenome]
MTRILALTNMYPPHHYGGYELLCRDVVTGLRGRGHEVSVLTTDWRVPGVADDRGESPSDVRRELSFYWDDHEILHPPLHRRVTIEAANRRRLRRTVRDLRPEVVSVWAMGAMSLGLIAQVRAFGLPMVHVVCDDWLEYGPSIDAWSRPFARHPHVGRVVTSLTGLPTDLSGIATSGPFCFISDATRRHAVEHFPWALEDTTVLYSGIDLADFPIDDRPPPPWRWRLLHVGRLDRRKGIDVAIQALALLPEEATLDVVGRGADVHRSDLMALARDRGVASRVRFSPHTDRAALRRHYRDADAFVFPVRWNEPFGLVPLEAMACGTPVVATGTGGSGEFLLDGVTCLRMPVDDPPALAGQLRRLAADEHLRATRAAGGRRAAQELSLERWTDHLEQWHVGAAEGFARGRPAERPSLVTVLVR